MFEASVNVLTSDEFLAMVQSIVDAFNCTPIEAANTAAVLPAFYVFLLAAFSVFVLDMVLNNVFRFSCWLFKLLKAQYQKRKEKGR